MPEKRKRVIIILGFFQGSKYLNQSKQGLQRWRNVFLTYSPGISKEHQDYPHGCFQTLQIISWRKMLKKSKHLSTH